METSIYKAGLISDTKHMPLTKKIFLGMASPALFAIVTLAASVSHSETLTPVELYKRCYIRMVRQVPVESDSLLLAVKAGTKKPEDACVELFDRAQFTTAGVLKNRTNPEAQAILKTFHNLHASWFQSKTYSATVASYIIHDLEEPPLYFTRAAFLPNTNISTVLTHNTGLMGVRDQKNPINPFLAQRLMTYPAGFPFSSETNLIISYTHITYDSATKKFVSAGVKPLVRNSNQIVMTGDLVGVQAALSVRFPSFRSVSNASADVIESVLKNMTNFDANGHFGGGVIGSQGFLLNNTNLNANQLPNEYALINRRLTTRVFEDLLCHQLPTLTDADIAAEVLPKSSHTFQQTSSCMRCHSSIDGMGYGFRNMVNVVSSANPTETGQQVGLPIQSFTALTPVSGATTFAVTTPEGRLHYRELVSGVKRDSKFTSLAQLGSVLASHSDLYTCAAKRYYQFFTGVNVDLSKAATDKLDKFHQDQVIALGKSLKTSQKVRSLLKEIFSSQAFQQRDYLTETSK